MTALTRRQLLVGAAGVAAMSMIPKTSRAEADVPPSLRKLADSKHLTFGSAIDPSLLKKPDFAALVVEQCNTVVPRNSLKWSSTEKRPGDFEFGEADAAVAFAAQHQIGVRGHTLVWHNVPDWVKKLDGAQAVTDAVVRHISTLMGRYKGRIASWDVVNEPFEYDAAKLRQSVFMKQLGEAYIDLSFKTAKSIDPAAQLVLNETHLYKQGDVYAAKRKEVLALVDRLQSRGVPIDAVGVQGHVRPGLDVVDKDGFASFCSELKARKLAILLTELDGSCKFSHRLPGFTDAGYAPPLAELISIAAGSGKLGAVIFWGLSPYGLQPNESGHDATCRYRINLFDDALQPLPTFDAVQSTLAGLSS